jgi:hypothetical protein
MSVSPLVIEIQRVTVVLTVPTLGDGQSLRERMTDVFQPDGLVAGAPATVIFHHTWNCELKLIDWGPQAKKASRSSGGRALP